MPKVSTRTLTLTALLVAIEIVLSRFLSISAWNIKIGFAFVPVAIAALLLGPVWAGITAALADFLGAILFPVGPYFPGFTLTAFLMGAVYGIFFYRKQSLTRVVLAVAVHQFVLSLLLNTLWISVLYGSPYGPLLLTRIPQSVLLAVVQVVVIEALVRLLPQLKRSLT